MAFQIVSSVTVFHPHNATSNVAEVQIHELNGLHN